MESRPRVPRPLAEVSDLTKRNGFGTQRPAKEGTMGELRIFEYPMIVQLKTAWKAFRYDKDSALFSYGHAMDEVRMLKYTALDVERFSRMLPELDGERDFGAKAGLFLSALINNGKETDYIIHTCGLAIDCIGYKNTKNILVVGNAGDKTGWAMTDGTIIVDGNTGKDTGLVMKGGKIHVEGELGGISKLMQHGKIFRKEELVADK